MAKIAAGVMVALALMSFTKPPTPVEVPNFNHDGFKVSGGQIAKVDTVKANTIHRPDTIAADSTGFTDIIYGDSITVRNDTLVLLTGIFEVAKPDTVQRDTSLMPLSYMTLISVVVPGFGQFYNREYWKIPVMWSAIGIPLYFGIQQHNLYSNYKRQYEELLAAGIDDRTIIDPIQRNMIFHNTWRQLLFGGALAAYIYTLADAVTHYRVGTEHIRMATTLSFVCPGLGQLYNGSYWKIPLFVGGFATFGYMIDWNNRGYVRYERAYKLLGTGNDEFTLAGWPRSEQELKNLRNAYRRNRDLCIILTGVWYLLNVLDAHVDAQLQDYDISDNLTWRNIRFEPQISPLYTQTGSLSMSYGLGINLKF